MENIHIIPTDKPSRLYKINSIGELDWSEGYLRQVDGATNQNLYITNSEEIKEGDWFIRDGKPIRKSGHIKHYAISEPKIILTTDPQLIADGVQAIDDDFSEWFVKNPSCEEVETKLVEQRSHLSLNDWVDEDENGKFPISIAGAFCYRKIYKIIIPQEEPKQETLEEHYLSIPKPLVDASRMKVDNHPDLIKQESLVEKMKPIQEQWQKDMEDSLNSKQEIIKESHKWLNDKFNGKGIEVRIIDWSKNEVNNYSPARLIEEYAKWMQERSYSEEEVLELLQDFANDLSDNVINIKFWFEQIKKK